MHAAAPCLAACAPRSQYYRLAQGIRTGAIWHVVRAAVLASRRGAQVYVLRPRPGMGASLAHVEFTGAGSRANCYEVGE